MPEQEQYDPQKRQILAKTLKLQNLLNDRSKFVMKYEYFDKKEQWLIELEKIEKLINEIIL